MDFDTQTFTGSPSRVQTSAKSQITASWSPAFLKSLVLALTAAVSEVAGEPAESIFLVIREMPGFNFVDAGEHVAEYQPGPDGTDLAGSEQLRARGKL